MDTAGAVVGAPLRGPRTYGELFRHRSFLGLLSAHAVSLIGDALARVALTTLVYARTGDPFLAAVAFGTFFLPLVVVGPLLGGLGDRVSRRSLLVATDLARAGLFALMALPGVPVWLLLLFVLASSSVEAAGSPARTPLMRTVLVDTRGYQLGSGVDESLNQVGQVIGYGLGGALLSQVAPRTAFSLDAVSFLLSATALLLLVEAPRAGESWRTVGRQLTAAGVGPMIRRAGADARAGVLAALAPRSRRPLLLTWFGLAAAIAPEALAVPWARDLGGGGALAGLLLAANPTGTIVGLLLVNRTSPRLRGRWTLALVLVALVPLLLAPLADQAWQVVSLVFVSGIGTAYSLLARVEFVDTLTESVKSRAFAVAAVGLQGTQVLGVFLAGALGEAVGADWSAAAMGAAGLAAAALVSAVRGESARLARSEAGRDHVICG